MNEDHLTTILDRLNNYIPAKATTDQQKKLVKAFKKLKRFCKKLHWCYTAPDASMNYQETMRWNKFTHYTDLLDDGMLESEDESEIFDWLIWYLEDLLLEQEDRNSPLHQVDVYA